MSSLPEMPPCDFQPDVHKVNDNYFSEDFFLIKQS